MFGRINRQRLCTFKLSDYSIYLCILLMNFLVRYKANKGESLVMTKKRILLVLGGLGNGGVQAVIMGIVRNLSWKYIFDVLLFTNERRHYDDEFLSYGGEIIRLQNYEGNCKFRRKLDYFIRGPRSYRSVTKLLREHGPYSAIHCNNEYESAAILKAAKNAGVPVRIAHTHHTYVIPKTSKFWLRGFNAICLKMIKKYATSLVGCSSEACLSMYGELSNSLVVDNPYDERKFSPNADAFGQHREMVLMQVGSFSTRKNQMFSVRVLAEIKKQYPNVKLNLVGFDIGDYQSKLEMLIEEMGVEENVNILPHDTNTAQYLETAAAFIFPSLEEGFGIVLIEAQAMGVRCYVSNTVPTAADRGGCTYLSLGDGPKVWADKIIEDYETYRGCHQFYDCSQFASQRTARNFDRLYSGENYEDRSNNIS